MGRDKKHQAKSQGISLDLDPVDRAALDLLAREQGFEDGAALARHWVLRTLGQQQKRKEKQDVKIDRKPAPLDAFLPQTVDPWQRMEDQEGGKESKLFQRIQKRQKKVSNSVQHLLGVEDV